jgi:hypothetical protein
MYQTTERSTVHGLGTPHGVKTPHRFPIFGLTSLTDVLSRLSQRLYPTGRAFYMPKGGIADRTHIAFNRSSIRLINDANATLDSTFPDNQNFTEDDCDLWEYRFGMVTNSATSVADRRAAIFRRMGRGRNVPARQHKNYLEYQLQIAGFNVFVFENGFIEGGVKVFKTPYEILNILPEAIQHGEPIQHGIGLQHGGGTADLIANSHKPNEIHSVGDNNLWATFFIGGENLGDMAEIPANREEEFRELVLRLKPAHLVAFTFINYI